MPSGMDVQDLIARYRGPLVGFLSSLGNDARTARELAQDTIVQAYLSRDRFRGSWAADSTGGSKAGPWLIGIARNLHLQNRRARRHKQWEPKDSASEPAQPNTPEVSESDALVARAVQGLSHEWREVLTMRYSDDHSLADIAEFLGITTRAVEGRLRRARKELEVRLHAFGVQTNPLASNSPRSSS